MPRTATVTASARSMDTSAHGDAGGHEPRLQGFLCGAPATDGLEQSRIGRNEAARYARCCEPITAHPLAVIALRRQEERPAGRRGGRNRKPRGEPLPG